MSNSATPPGRPLAAALAAAALLLTQCGGDPPPAPAPQKSGIGQTSKPAPSDDAMGTALLSWQPPTQREDGSPLDDLAGYRIQYGMNPDWLDSSVALGNPGLTSYLVEGLTAGRWYFTIRSVDADGRQSEPSGTASKEIG